MTNATASSRAGNVNSLVTVERTATTVVTWCKRRNNDKSERLVQHNRFVGHCEPDVVMFRHKDNVGDWRRSEWNVVDVKMCGWLVTSATGLKTLLLGKKKDPFSYLKHSKRTIAQCREESIVSIGQL